MENSMSGKTRLLWCILIVILLTIVTGFWQYSKVEKDLLAKSNAVLNSDQKELIDLQITARDLTLSGYVLSEENKQNLLTSLDAEYGVRKVNSNLKIIPTQAPYTLSIRSEAELLELNGSYPRPAIRDQILASVKSAFPNKSILDNLSIAQGLGTIDTNEWLSTFEANIGNLNALNTGTLELSDNMVSLFGEAKTSQDYETLIAQSPLNFSENFAQGKVNIDPPLASPFITEIDIKDNISQLDGYATSVEARDQFNTIINATSDSSKGALEIARGIGEEKFNAFTNFSSEITSLIKNGKISLKENDITILGEADKVDDYYALQEIISKGPEAGLNIDNVDILPAYIDPYTLSATQKNGFVDIKGYALSQNAKDSIQARSAQILEGKSVKSEIKLARGMKEESWASYSDFAFNMLNQLNDGSVELQNDMISITGDAISHEAYDRLKAEDFELPFGLSVKEINIDLPTITPYTAEITKDTDSNFTMTGYLPDLESKNAIKEAISDRFGRFEVTDNTRLANGAPEGFSEAISGSLGLLTRLASGSISLSDKTINLSGGAYAETALSDLKKNAIDGYSFLSNVTKAEAGSALDLVGCQARLSYWMGATKIRFETGSARIDKASHGLIETLSYDINRCENLMIEIGGHTDSVGDPNQNMRLSQARARAVYSDFIKNGVKDSLLSTVGYGQTTPIADNETKEGRAQNRRIEFTVKLIEEAPAELTAPSSGE